MELFVITGLVTGHEPTSDCRLMTKDKTVQVLNLPTAWMCVPQSKELNVFSGSKLNRYTTEWSKPILKSPSVRGKTCRAFGISL